MLFRTKLLLIMISLAVASSVAIAALLEYRARKTIFETFQAKALSMAAATAEAIDPSLHATLRTRNDEGSAAYVRIRDLLRRIRNANRREDTRVSYLYTVARSAEAPHLLMFVVDAEEDPAKVSHLGDVVRAQELKDIDISKPQVFDDFIQDEWGRWLTAFYPIRNSEGEAIAAVAVDIDSRRVLGFEKRFFTYGLLVLGLSIALSLLAALFTTRLVLRPLHSLQEGMRAVARGNFSGALPSERKDEFGDALNELSTMAKGLEERERVKSAFSRYVSHQVADAILASGNPTEMKGTRRRVTVLFSDIRGFTAMSEHLKPEEVVGVLNDYFERMVEIVFRNNGTLDKFIGDGLMAIFGAPAEDPDQEEHALRAALEMRQALSEIAVKIRERHGVELRIGMGINSGHAIVGNIGSSKRMEYTAIGDPVNLASRLESHTKELGVDLLISEYTAYGLQGSFSKQLRKIGAVKVRGRNEEVTVYTCD
jgi:adenylate cyclase